MAPLCTSSDAEFLRHAQILEHVLAFCHAGREAEWVDYDERASDTKLKETMVSNEFLVIQQLVKQPSPLY